MKRFVSCLVALLLLLTCLTFTMACGKESEESGETGGVLGEVSTDSDGKRYDANGYLLDDLPDDLNYGGKDLTVLTCEEMAYAVAPTELNNSVLNDTGYRRNTEIEARLGVKLNFVLQTGVPTATGIYEGFSSKVSTAVSAGDGEFDLVCAFSLGPADWAVQGLLLNIDGNKYLDFEKPWWSYSVLENKFYNTIYYAGTTSSGNTLDQMSVVFYNKQMLAENGIENEAGDALTKRVLEGKWTLANLYEYSKNLYEDTNPDGLHDLGDTYGLVFSHSVYADQFFYGSGFNVARINESTGLPELTFKDSGELNRIVDFLRGMISTFQLGDSVIASTSANYDQAINFLKENRCAFYAGKLGDTANVPDSDIWGVLPTPKLDENQENYITTPNNDFDMWCMMKGTKDTEMSGAFMEAYASGCYRTVAPAYYDDALSYRYSSSMEGVEIFGLIKQNVKFDVGRLNSFSIGTVDEWIRDCYRNQTQSFMQSWATNQRKVNNNLNKVIDGYKNVK